MKILRWIKNDFRLSDVVRRFKGMRDGYKLSLVMDLMEIGKKKNAEIALCGDMVKETYLYRKMELYEKVIQLKLDIIHILFY